MSVERISGPDIRERIRDRSDVMVWVEMKHPSREGFGRFIRVDPDDLAYELSKIPVSVVELGEDLGTIWIHSIEVQGGSQ